MLDGRYQGTARRIHTSLEALLEQKLTADTSDITIQELCQKANITRGTFYRHYKSISAVVAEAEQYLFSEYVKVLYSTPEAEREPRNLIRSILEIVGKNKTYFRMVFARNDYNLMMDIFKVTKPLMQDTWKNLNYSADSYILDKMYHFCAYGVIGIVKHWVIEQNCDSSLIDEYTDFTLNIAHDGMNSFAQSSSAE